MAKVDPKVKAEEEKKKAEEAAQEKASREQAKKQKEAAKKAVKKEAKAISALVSSLNYFSPSGSSPSAAQVEGTLAEVDRLVAGLEPEEVGKVRKEMEEQKGKGAEEVKSVAAGWAKKVEQQDGKGAFKVLV